MTPRTSLTIAASALALVVPAALHGAVAYTPMTPDQRTTSLLSAVKANPLASASLASSAKGRPATVLRQTIRRGSPEARVIWGKVSPMVRFTVGTSCGAMTSCVEWKGQRMHVQMNPAHMSGSIRHSFLQWHEIGHVVVNESANTRLVERFIAKVRAAGAWKCLPNPLGGGCVNEEEWFADEFARWAVGSRSLRSGYRIPSVFSRAQMGAFLQENLWFAIDAMDRDTEARMAEATYATPTVIVHAPPNSAVAVARPSSDTPVSTPVMPEPHEEEKEMTIQPIGGPEKETAAGAPPAK